MKRIVRNFSDKLKVPSGYTGANTPVPKWSFQKQSFYTAWKDVKQERMIANICSSKVKTKNIENIKKLISQKEFNINLEIDNVNVSQQLVQKYLHGNTNIEEVLTSFFESGILNQTQQFIIFEMIIKENNSELLSKQSKYITKNNQVQDQKSLVHVAAFSGNLDAMKLLVKIKVDINQVDLNGMTPIILSIIRKKLEIAKYLLQKGAIASYEDNSGHIAAFYALQNEEYILFEEFLKSGAQETPSMPILNYAISLGNMNTIKWLLKFNKHIDVNKKSKDGLSSIHFSILSKNDEIFKLLFNQKDINLRTKDIQNNNLIHSAVSIENLSIIQDLSNTDCFKELLMSKNKDDLQPMDLANAKLIKGKAKDQKMVSIQEKVKFEV